MIEGENCLRAAIVNHRTSEQDIVDVIKAVASYRD